LFKNYKHILFSLCLFGLLSIFVGCKGSKTASAKKTFPANQKGDSGMHTGMARFGFYYVDGCSERKKGNLNEAIKLFEECKKIDPKNPAVYYELATTYHLLGSNEVALTNAKVCAAADPKNEWYQLILIDCYNSLKLYYQSVKVREALVKQFPLKSEFKEDLAIEYAVLGYYDKSFKIYAELEEVYGINEQITLNKVKLLKSQKKYKEAEQELLKLAKSDPTNPKYCAYLAELYLELNKQEEAKLMFDKILALDPQNPEIHLALHNYYINKGQDSIAYYHLTQAFLTPDLDIETKTDILNSFLQRAQMHDAQAFTDGMALAKIMVQVHPTSGKAHFNYGNFLKTGNKSKEAAASYYTAAGLDRRDYKIWDNLLYTDYLLQEYDSLEHHSRMAIDIFPSQAQNYKYNGLANIELKNYSKAAQSLKEGLEFSTENSQRLDFLSLLGDAYFNLKEYPKADAAFEEALKINADNTYILNNYAYYLSLRCIDLPKAELLSKRANQLKPNERSYIDTYGWILYQQKKYTEAEEWLSKAANMGPKNATILEHYGDVLYKLNKSTEAMVQWEAAKKSGGNSEELLNKIKTKKLND
jgi:tetratricopeptide (TPR) repeat protein